MALGTGVGFAGGGGGLASGTVTLGGSFEAVCGAGGVPQAAAKSPHARVTRMRRF